MKGIETLGGRNSASSLVVLQHKKKELSLSAFSKKIDYIPYLPKKNGMCT